jgi:deoxyribose-phosphate aldolase
MAQTIARKELARLIELTLRTADATRADIERLCAEARAHGAASVCVNGSRVALAVHLLEESDVKVTGTVAFPLGASDADVKRFETEAAVDCGAHFIEVTANMGRLKDGDQAYVLRELRDVVEAADERPVSVGVDLDFLAAAELSALASVAVEAGVKGVCLAGGPGAVERVEAVKRFREAAGDDFGIKVDQPSMTLDDVVALLDAGITRLGVEDAASLLENT